MNSRRRSGLGKLHTSGSRTVHLPGGSMARVTLKAETLAAQGMDKKGTSQSAIGSRRSFSEAEVAGVCDCERARWPMTWGMPGRGRGRLRVALDKIRFGHSGPAGAHGKSCVPGASQIPIHFFLPR